MNILFLSLRCPFPPNRGDRIRNYYFIKYLAETHRVTLISFIESDDEEVWEYPDPGDSFHVTAISLSAVSDPDDAELRFFLRLEEFQG